MAVKISLVFMIALMIVLMAFSGNDKKEVVFTDKAPAPIGPYSQAIRSAGILFVSGQIALRADGSLDTSSIENECRQVMTNIKAIVEAAGMKMNEITKTSIFTTALKQFSKINEVYKTYFVTDPPARETIEVRALPKGAHVEISVIAN
jgi:2-iminobutanoate/2-iminopropanoate deaminase